MDRISKNRVILFCAALFLFTAFLFFYTVQIRQQWFGRLSMEHSQWLTGSAVKFTRMWLRESPIKLGFGMFENPASAEFPTLESRNFYSSYPPGVLLPVYILALAAGGNATPGLVMAYNLFNHFGIALSLSLLVFFLLLRNGFSPRAAFLFGLVPPVVELLMPSPLYWHQNAYWADQAVLLPFAFFLFLEIFRDTKPGAKHRVWAGALQGVVLFYGAFTDWFFCFVALAVYAKRAVRGELGAWPGAFIRRSLVFWAPAALALGFFAAQLALMNGWPRLLRMFFYRTGGSSDAAAWEKNILEHFNHFFWGEHVSSGFGRPAVFFLWGSLAVLLLLGAFIAREKLKKKDVPAPLKNTAMMAALLLVPCFLQVYFVRAHSGIHDFSALKFALPLAAVPFALLPAAAAMFFNSYLKDRLMRLINPAPAARLVNAASWALPLLMFAAASVYTVLKHPDYRGFFPKPADFSAESFIAAHTGRTDVVFSPCFEVPDNPPQQLCYSMKRVYRAGTLKEIADMTRGISNSFNVCVFTVSTNPACAGGGLPGLLKKIGPAAENGIYRLYRIESTNL